MNLCPYEGLWEEEPPKRDKDKERTKHRTGRKVPPQPQQQQRSSEGFVTATPPPPPPLSGAPPSTTSGSFQVAEKSVGEGLFPLPGETGTDEEWAKVFSLDAPSAAAAGTMILRPDGSVPVDGKPTQWRHIAAPPVAPPEWIVTQNPPPLPPPSHQPAPFSPLSQQKLPSASAPITDIASRLDQLTVQLDALTMPQGFQGTAELFLFVAIGLLLLLAIDLILRMAISFVTATVTGPATKMRRMPQFSRRARGGQLW